MFPIWVWSLFQLLVTIIQILCPSFRSAPVRSRALFYEFCRAMGSVTNKLSRLAKFTATANDEKLHHTESSRQLEEQRESFLLRMAIFRKETTKKRSCKVLLISTLHQQVSWEIILQKFQWCANRQSRLKEKAHIFPQTLWILLSASFQCLRLCRCGHWAEIARTLFFGQHLSIRVGAQFQRVRSAQLSSPQIPQEPCTGLGLTGVRGWNFLHWTSHPNIFHLPTPTSSRTTLWHAIEASCAST